MSHPSLTIDEACCAVQVFNFQSGALVSVIDSHGSRLRRPTGIAVGGAGDRYAYCVDIGTETIRKFRYK